MIPQLIASFLWSPLRSSLGASILIGLAVGLAPSQVLAQPAEGLASYFGFDEPRVVVLDEGCGPAIIGDFNGDGRPDVAIANNRKSRIEVHYLRDARRTPEETQRVLKANELAPSPWYDPIRISVAHRVGGLRARDVDGDGKPDLVYAGSDPSEIVVLRQVDPTKFELMARQRVRDLAASRYAFDLADVQGDGDPEVLVIAESKINVFPLARSGRLGEPTVLGSGGGSGGELRMIRIADVNGDRRPDVVGVVPEDAAPLRVWLQGQDPRSESASGLLSRELRFEMPAIVDAVPLIFSDKHVRAGHDHPGQGPGMIVALGVIERASRREVFYDLASRAVAEPTGPTGEREVQAAVTAFPDTASKNRSTVLADFDGDGRTDLLTTDQKANALVLFRQQAGTGLSSFESFSAFKQPKMIDVGRWTDGPGMKVFVLSEQEKAVGMCSVEERGSAGGGAGGAGISFPSPVTIATPGATPLVLAWFEQGGSTGIAQGGEARGTEARGTGAPVLAVVCKAQRDYSIELHQDPGRDGLKEGEQFEAATAPLKELKRDPVSALPFDADRDGVTDVLLLTPGEAMVVVRCEMKDGKVTPTQVLTKDQMPQFGLVQAAGPENTARFDTDGDGRDELLIADANFVRACAFDLRAGWRVVEQVNVPDSASQLAGLALLRAEGSGRGGGTRAANTGNGAAVPAAGGADAAGHRSPAPGTGIAQGGEAPATAGRRGTTGTTGTGRTWIVAGDKAGGRLIVFERDQTKWVIRDRIRLLGFGVASVRAGSFAGDGEPGILCLADDAFALVPLAGQRPSLEQFAAHRAESEDRQDFQMASGDLNSDGYLDLAVLDAREQMCQVLTFSASRKLYPGTEFEVFESRLFSGGDRREFEPREVSVADATGDGKHDLVLVVHDRVIVYPQAAGK